MAPSQEIDVEDLPPELLDHVDAEIDLSGNKTDDWEAALLRGDRDRAEHARGRARKMSRVQRVPKECVSAGLEACLVQPWHFRSCTT